VQLLFAVATLYRTRGDQINQFGYAAFGLTVIQYGLMSLINLLGNLMCPQYPTMYLVQSSTLMDAQHDGAVIEGIVGVLDEDTNGALPSTRQPGGLWKGIIIKLWWIPLCWSPLVVTLGIIGALSHFRPGKSSLDERILTMAWLAIGSWTGIAAYVEVPRAQFKTWGIYMGLAFDIIILLVGGAPVAAAFWVVAKEIMQYGICARD